MGNKQVKYIYLETPISKEEINANLLNKPDKIIIKVYNLELFTIKKGSSNSFVEYKKCYFPQFNITIYDNKFEFNSSNNYSYCKDIPKEYKIKKPKLLKTIELEDNQELFDFICMKFKVKEKESEIYSMISNL
jgi:hypothetical protein